MVARQQGDTLQSQAGENKGGAIHPSEVYLVYDHNSSLIRFTTPHDHSSSLIRFTTQLM
jgi:hypothetical protein